MSKRKVVKVLNAPRHKNPIPTCVMIGNLILPSVIGGQDPQAPEPSQDPEKQVRQAFINMKNIIEAAGGTTDNIGKVIVYLKDFRHREFVNREWLQMFSDENNRPARHVIKVDLQGNTFIQLDVIAAL
jgi:enamine deaminase RidA (YjgF/YER057c/UK114 family)